MRVKIAILVWLIASFNLDAISVNVQAGVERFACYRDLLAGRKVAIVANQTSCVGDSHAVDFLRGKGVNLVKVFCPEHGFRGNADAGENIGNYVDAESGLPVLSLYGKHKKPRPEDLRDVDVVLFDIQDVGVRFYTYLSTLHYVMEACAETGIPLIVMDRPNPNAFYVDGPILRGEHASFVGMHPVPVVYGMTIGEYARMINGEGWLKGGVACQLTVIPCEGWDRRQIVALPHAPSPNLPDSVSVLLYPSTCFFEGTVVSEGRGTLRPFQLFGHPDLADMPFSFVPEPIEGMCSRPKCEGRICHGMDLRAEAAGILSMRRINLEWLLSAYEKYEGEEPFFNSLFDKLTGDSRVREYIEAGKSEREIRALWENELPGFMAMRQKYLMYD